MQLLLIVAMCIGAAVLYGIVHDQITARVCVEYFTIGHPPIFGTDDPTLLGLGWGVIATWWVGVLLGVPLAVTARVGPWPKRSAASLVRPIAYLLAVMALCAFIAGIVGWVMARNGTDYLVGPIADEIPANRHALFLADYWAHSTSYFVGSWGGIVLIIAVVISRIHAAAAANSRGAR